MGNSIKKCEITISTLNSGLYTSTVCGRKAKYEVEYKSGVNSKKIKECLCGIHFKSAQKLNKRLLKQNYDNKLKWTELYNQSNQ